MAITHLNRRQYKALVMLAGVESHDGGRDGDPSMDFLHKQELATRVRWSVGSDYRSHSWYAITEAGRDYLKANPDWPEIELSPTGIAVIEYILDGRDGKRAAGYDSHRPGNIKTVEALIAQGAVEEVARDEERSWVKDYQVTTDGKQAFLKTPTGAKWQAGRDYEAARERMDQAADEQINMTPDGDEIDYLIAKRNLLYNSTFAGRDRYVGEISSKLNRLMTERRIRKDYGVAEGDRVFIANDGTTLREIGFAFNLNIVRRAGGWGVDTQNIYHNYISDADNMNLNAELLGMELLRAVEIARKLNDAKE